MTALQTIHGTDSMAQWSTALYTDTGKIRKINEDSIYENSSEQLWAVADGMGGHEGGDYASQYVVSSLGYYRKTPYRGVTMNRLTALLQDCNKHLVDKANAEQRGIIGCTVAILTAHDQHAVCSWSGDSRIYRLRNQRLTQLTRDHSYESLAEDRDVVSHPEVMLGDPQMLTSAIGGETMTRIEHCYYALEPDDRFLVCTDGLYKEVTDEQIENELKASENPEEVISALAETYQANGARDNVGIICTFLDSHA